MPTTWSAFYPDVLPDLPGAPAPMVDHYLRNAAIEFCERSKAWVVDLAPVDAVAGQMKYVLPLPIDTELAEIQEARFSSNRITPKAPAFLVAQHGNWATEVGTPIHYTHESTDSILLIPAPADTAIGAIKIRATIRPALNAAAIDDWLYSRYRFAIAAGCKALMMVMANKPWTNADLAVVNAGIFESTVTKATGAAANGFTNARPRFSGKMC